MATSNGSDGYRPGLVDLATGRISREIFVNEAIYAEELERVFARGCSSAMKVRSPTQAIFRVGDGRGIRHPVPRRAALD